MFYIFVFTLSAALKFLALSVVLY